VSLLPSGRCRYGFKKRKHCPCKPGSVLSEIPIVRATGTLTVPAIYLLPVSPQTSSVLPSTASPLRQTRAGNPHMAVVYMNLQPPAGTARRSPAAWWSLTPPSHPYPSLQSSIKEVAVVLFFPHQPSPTASIFRSGVPYAARTFLPPCP